MLLILNPVFLSEGDVFDPIKYMFPVRSISENYGKCVYFPKYRCMSLFWSKIHIFEFFYLKKYKYRGSVPIGDL